MSDLSAYSRYDQKTLANFCVKKDIRIRQLEETVAYANYNLADIELRLHKREEESVRDFIDNHKKTVQVGEKI